MTGRSTAIHVDVTGMDRFKALAADLAEALQLLDEMFSQPLPTDWEARAHDLLARHGVRQ